MSKRKRAEKLVGKTIRIHSHDTFAFRVLAVDVEWDGRTQAWTDVEVHAYEKIMGARGEKKVLCLKLQPINFQDRMLWRKVNSRVTYEVVTG